MVQFLSINFFSWISSIFVGFFKSSRFFCVTLYKEYIRTYTASYPPPHTEKTDTTEFTLSTY